MGIKVIQIEVDCACGATSYGSQFDLESIGWRFHFGGTPYIEDGSVQCPNCSGLAEGQMRPEETHVG